MLNRRTAVALLAVFLFCVTISSDAVAGPFQIGDLIAYNQDSWGTTSTTAGILLNSHFDTVYPGGAEVGIIGPAGNSALFSSPSAVFNYLPADGVPGPLDNDLQDPITTSAGVFGGHVLAIQLDVDFYDAGKLSGSSGVKFGDLVVHGLTSTTEFNGLTVRQVLAQLNTALGDEVTPRDFDALDAFAENLGSAFEAGTPSQFAQDHLAFPGQAPQPVPEPATLSLLGIGITTLTIRRFKRKG